MTNRVYYVLALGTFLLASPLNAEGGTMSNWELDVTNILGRQTYSVAPDGGKVPGTGMVGCDQAPVRAFKDKDGQVQEQVRVTCPMPLGPKVTLIQGCYGLRVDSSWGAMRVEGGVDNFTISLSCHTP
jgi:hypothetical protein